MNFRGLLCAFALFFASYGWTIQISDLRVAADKKLAPKVVPRDGSPLYDVIQKLYDKLIAAQQKIDGDHFLLHDMRIVDSPALQIEVHNASVEGRSDLDSCLYISKGTIENLFPQGRALTDAEVKAGTERLAGMIARAITLPRTTIEDPPRSGSSHDQAEREREAELQQAKALEADVKTINLLETAGIAREAHYNALEYMRANPELRRSGFFFGAEANVDLRMSALVHVLTYRRFKEGEGRRDPLPAVTDFRSSVEALTHNQYEREYVPVNELPNILKRLKDFSKNGLAGYGAEVEFNRLVLAAHQWGHDHPQMDEHDAALFAETMLQIKELNGSSRWDSKPRKIWGPAERAKYFSDKPSDPQAHLPTQAESVAVDPVFKDPHYLRALVAGVREKIAESNEEGDRHAHVRQYNLEEIASSIRAVAPLADEAALAATLKGDIESLKLNGFGEAVSLVAPLPNGIQLALSPSLTLPDGLSLDGPQLLNLAQFNTDVDASHSFVPIKSRDRPFNRSRSTPQAPLNGTDQQAFDAERKRWAERIWRDAGDWATAELFGTGANIDWEEIWKTLGISETDGKARLNKEVRAFTRAHRYFDMLRTVQAALEAKATEGRYEDRKPYPEGWSGDRVQAMSRRLAGDHSWASSETISALQGLDNPQVRNVPALCKVAQSVVVDRIFESEPRHFKNLARLAFTRELAKMEGVTAANLQAKLIIAYRNAIDSLVQRNVREERENYFVKTAIDEPWVAALDRSSLPPELKRTALREFLFTQGSDYLVWGGRRLDAAAHAPIDFYHRNLGEKHDEYLSDVDRQTDARKILEVIDRNHVTDSIVGEIIAGTKVKDSFGFEKHITRVGKLSDRILTEMKEWEKLSPRDRAAKILEFSDAAFQYAGKDYYNDYYFDRYRETESVKAELFRMAHGAELNHGEKLSLFADLTATGATLAGDAYFENEIFSGNMDRGLIVQYLGGDPSERRAAAAAGDEKGSRRFLTRLRSPGARLRAAQYVLETERAELAKLSKDNPDYNRRMHSFLEKIDAWVPEGSIQKDDYLEDCAKEMHLSGPLLALTEELKSYNHKKLNPAMLRIGSSGAEYLSYLSNEARNELIEYLRIADQDTPLPNRTVSELKAIIEHRVGAENRENLEEVTKRREKTFREVVGAMRTLAVREREPLIQLVLTAGEQRLLNTPENIGQILERHMGLKGKELLRLQTAIEALPEHERSVALATFLSHIDPGQTNTAHLYEFFDFTGIKAAQWVARWNLFGKEHSESVRHLDYNATPITLAEVHRIAKETMGAEFAKIDHFDKILSAASGKVAVRIVLKNGDTRVMLVQRPSSPKQVGSHLQWAKNYLALATQRGLVDNPAFIGAMLEDYEEQLHEELDYRREGPRLKESQASLDKVASEMSKDMNGYHFEVPQLDENFTLHENLMIVTEAHGENIGAFLDRRATDPHARAIVEKAGPVIHDSSVIMRMRHGTGNADPNGGAFMIDGNTIYALDMGQYYNNETSAAPWKDDDRLKNADFFEAFGRRDAAKLVAAAVRVARDPLKATPENRARATAAIAAAFRDPDLSHVEDLAPKVLELLVVNGLRPERKFTIGALQQMLILQTKGYVTPEHHEQVMAREIARTNVQKFVVAGPAKAAASLCHLLLGGGKK